MTNERYAKMIKYKSALDNCWKKKDRLNIYGEHKLIDNVKSEGEAKMRDMFANAMRSR